MNQEKKMLVDINTRFFTFRWIRTSPNDVGWVYVEDQELHPSKPRRCMFLYGHLWQYLSNIHVQWVRGLRIQIMTANESEFYNDDHGPRKTVILYYRFHEYRKMSHLYWSETGLQMDTWIPSYGPKKSKDRET